MRGGQVSENLDKTGYNMKKLFPGILAMATIVVVSNILVQFFIGNWLTWGAFTYPFAFLVTDIINRMYGPSDARRVVFFGFIVGIICSLIGTRNYQHRVVHLMQDLSERYHLALSLVWLAKLCIK